MRVGTNVSFEVWLKVAHIHACICHETQMASVPEPMISYKPSLAYRASPVPAYARVWLQKEQKTFTSVGDSAQQHIPVETA